MKIKLFLITSLAYLSAISMSSTALKEEIIIKDGKKTVIESVIKSAIPGDTILYKNLINNDGNKTTQKLTVTNPMPTNLTYKANSAACSVACDITFAINGSKEFKDPNELYVIQNKTKRLAKPSEYTAIRWSLKKSLKPSEKAFVSYKATLN